MKKQWLLLFTLLLFAFLLLACKAPPATGGEPLPLTDGTFVYKEIAVGETVTGYAVAGLEDETATELVIPATHNDLPVSRIDKNAFYKNRAITSIVVPASVTEIGEDAFRGCASLVNVTFAEGSGLHTIGASAFEQCKALREITLPPSVRTIHDFIFLGCSNLETARVTGPLDGFGAAVFMYCTALEGVELPSIKKLPSQTFSGCTSLTFVWLGAIEEIGEAAFSGCTSLVGFHISQTKYIAANAFSGCVSLLDLKNLYNLEEIGADAFSGCTSLLEVKNLKKLKKIGDRAFAKCTSLQNLELPETLKEIGVAAFQNCWRIESVTIPSGVDRIGERAFFGCSMQTITLPFASKSSSDGGFAAIFGGSKNIPHSLTTVILNSNYPIVERAFEGCDGILYLEIPQGLPYIGEDAFVGCTRLVMVKNGSGLPLKGLPELPDQQIFQEETTGKLVTEKDCVFYHYENRVYLLKYLKSVAELDLRDTGVTAIYPYVFYENKWLRSVTLPEGLTSIGEKAFYYCPNLERMALPATLTHIGKDAFTGCYGLSVVEIPNLARWCGITFDNISANPLYNNGVALLVDGETVRELTLHATVDKINAFAFSGYKLLERVTIGTNVKEIGKFAFYQCSALQAFHFEDAVGWSSNETVISAEELADFETVMLHISKTYYKTPWIKE